MGHVGAGPSRVCEDDERRGARAPRSSPPLDFALENATMNRHVSRSPDLAAERQRPRTRPSAKSTTRQTSSSVRDRDRGAPTRVQLADRVGSCRAALAEKFGVVARCARSERKYAVWHAEAPQSAIDGTFDATPRRLSGYRLESAPFYAALECASSGAYRVECAAVHTVSARFCCVVVASPPSDSDPEPHADRTLALVLELIREAPSPSTSASSSAKVRSVARRGDGGGGGGGGRAESSDGSGRVESSGDEKRLALAPPSSSSAATSASRILAEAWCRLETDGVTPTLQILYRGRLAVGDRIHLRLSLQSCSYGATRTNSVRAAATRAVEHRVLPVRLAPWLPGAATFQISHAAASTTAAAAAASGRPTQNPTPLVSRI